MPYIPKLSNLFSLIIYMMVSWILVHTVAIFGLFLSLAYPLWWLFFPEKTLCFFCRFAKEGQNCKACGTVIKSDSLYPKNFYSAFMNAVFFAVLTTFFVGIVYVESIFLSSLIPPQATSFFSIPAKGQYAVGESIELLVELNDIRQPVNVVQSDISFDTKVLKLKEIDTQNSFARIFVQKEVDNKLGYARIVGGVTSPGFVGNKAEFATFIFEAIAPGATEVTFLPTSMVLANDGNGTNVLKEYGAAQYIILPDTVPAQGDSNSRIEITTKEIDSDFAQAENRQAVAYANQNQLELYDAFSVILGSSFEASASDTPTTLSNQPDTGSSSDYTPNKTAQPLHPQENTWWQKIALFLYKINEAILSFYKNLFTSNK